MVNRDTTADLPAVPAEPRLTLGDYNKIARENADLRDAMATLKTEIAETQERWGQETAALRLTAGATFDEVNDETYEDAHKVMQALKDRCWEQGFEAGLDDARKITDAALLAAKESKP